MRSLQQIGLRACGTCRDFAPVFERRAATSHAAFFRVDIEDHEVVVDSIEVENFPTLLIARGDAVLFFGPITPQRQTLSTLLQAARDGDLKLIDADPAVADLPAHVRRRGIQIRPSAC